MLGVLSETVLLFQFHPQVFRIADDDGDSGLFLRSNADTTSVSSVATTSSHCAKSTSHDDIIISDLEDKSLIKNISTDDDVNNNLPKPDLDLTTSEMLRKAAITST